MARSASGRRVQHVAVGRALEGHGDDVTSVDFNPVGTMLASGSRDTTVRRWDAKTGTPIGEPLIGHTDRVVVVQFSPDGQPPRLRVCATDRSACGTRSPRFTRRRPVGHLSAVRYGDARPCQVQSLAFHPERDLLAVGLEDGLIELWDVGESRMVRPLPGHTKLVSESAFSPDGERLASSSEDNTLRLWDPDRGPVGEPLTGHTRIVNGLA